MNAILLVGRVIHIEHPPEGAALQSSLITLDVQHPYPHVVDVEVPWMPLIYPHHPGDEFIDRLEDAGTIVVRAKLDDSRLIAMRNDIFVNTQEWR